MSKKQSVAIIWWWAAGMMVAATIAERTDREGQVLLFEKNKSLGAKVIISGGGRCNLTTGFSKRADLQSKYTRGREFFDPSLKKFTPRSVKKRFEALWIPCKIEEDMRVFPVSDDGKDVVKAFESVFDDERINIHFSEWAESISKQWDYFQITSKRWSYEVDKVVLTTWGNAYSHTWSTWDGYHFAQAMGHTITPLGPSLNSFVTQEQRITSLSWLSFPDATVHLSLPIQVQDLDAKDLYNTIHYQDHKSTWPILLTHFGISWPLTFVAASLSAFEEVLPESPLRIKLQVLGDLNYEQRNHYLLNESQTSKKELVTTLANKLPKRFCEALLAELEFQHHMPISQLSKKQRLALADHLGNWIPLSLIKRRPGDEFVTAGWVSTTEIDPKTMESLITPGLYFAGEILNVDGVTGGYNLQMCWATGRSVGLSI